MMVCNCGIYIWLFIYHHETVPYSNKEKLFKILLQEVLFLGWFSSLSTVVYDELMHLY